MLIKLSGRTAQGQQGAVLILALFVVVLVTTVVVSVSWRFQLSMARNENRWHGAQARAYMEGAEQLARMILREDLNQGPVDFLGEMWATFNDTLPTDEGWVRGTIEDAHGRFNLNLLLPPPPPSGQQDQNASPPATEAEVYSASQRRFIRLLQTLELENGPLDEGMAKEITDAVQDWLDPDSEVTRFGGAEASHYQSGGSAYPISNDYMVNVSELSMVKGITPEIYQKLVPLVIALPPDVKMNINTMKPELLRTLNHKDDLLPLPEADWQALVEERATTVETGYENVDMFVQGPNAQAVLGGAGQFDDEDLTVSSSYFLLFAETEVGEQVRRSKTLLFRGDGDVVIVRRTDAEF